ncbi:hypothetical protein KUCAC02_017057, partial [Chaenocephalus aceratus]
VCSCFVRGDRGRRYRGPETLHGVKPAASCCLQSRFHLCRSLCRTSLDPARCRDTSGTETLEGVRKGDMGRTKP